MKNKWFPIVAALLALALASLACQALTNPGGVGPAPAQPADPGVETLPTAAATRQPSADTPAMPEKIQPQGEGLACFGLRDGGLTCLDESGWKTYNQDNSELTSNYLNAGGVCPDGRIVIAHYQGISLFDGSTWQNIGKSDGYSSAESISCAADGSLWVGHFKGVSRYANGSWTTYGSELLATGDSANDLVYNVVPGADGRVWAVTSRSVAVFENDSWSVFQEGQGFNESVFFNTLTVDSLNRPWAGTSSAVYVYDGAWKKINRPGFNTPYAMAVDATGKIWMGTLQGVSFFDGIAWTDLSRKSGKLPADNIKDITADSLGRVWVATTYGLAVFDGKDWRTYRMDNSDLGDNEISFVVVVKDGPSLPAPTPKATGSLTGKLEDASGKPLEGMRVEICVESLGTQFSGETPCSEQPFFLVTKTDSDGSFTFSDVPAGYYVLVAETGDGWAQLTTEFGFGSERTPILAGENYDIGTLTLTEE